jgi:predicted patatin/cPLA2 family phospholipase
VRALVLEGGGMRASYSNGVLAAFEDAGLRRFDAVYGTSAGGALAAWFAAGQARYALGTWAYAHDPRVWSYARWWTLRGPLLDHDLLFRAVYAKEHPLDVHAVRHAPFAVYVTVTDVESGRARYVDLRRGRVLDWLRATGRLPVGAGSPVEIEGRRWLDGGLADPIPIRRAIDDGAKNIVCVLDEAPGRRSPEPRLASYLIGRRYPSLRHLVEQHHELHDDAVRVAEHPPRGVEVHLIRPAVPTRVGRLTRDRRRLDLAILQGETDGRAFAKGEGTAFVVGHKSRRT